MKVLIMKYPGDPAVKVQVMSRAEFFVLFPPETRRITITGFGADGFCQETHKLGERIHCDLCNEDPQDFIALVDRARVYCESCYNQSLRRYCKEVI